MRVGITWKMGCMCARIRFKPSEVPQASTKKSTPPPIHVPDPEPPPSPNSPLTVQMVTGQVRLLTEPITSTYKFIEKIVANKTYEIVLAEHITTKQRCTLKLYVKPEQEMVRKARKKFEEEAGILSRMDHPNIVRIYEVLEDEKHFILVGEELTEINLIDVLADLPEITEEFAARIFTQIFHALNYAHSLGVIHSSLCFSTLILKEKTKEPANIFLKLEGFGDAVLASKAKKTVTTPTVYIAPEMFAGRFDEKCDVWSCGIMLYTMLSGNPPFKLNKYINNVKRQKTKEIPFHSESWADVSSDAKALITSMLKWDFKLRFSMAQCLQSPWMKQNIGRTSLTGRTVRNTLKNLIQSQACSMLKDAVKAFIVLRVAKQADFSELIESFQALDLDGDGLISMEELKTALGKIMPEAEARAEATRIMKVADKNENGHMDYLEFLLSANNEKKVLSTKNLTLAFNSIDTDNSGKITLNELKKVFFVGGSSEKERLWQSLLKIGDTSGDGEIDFNEFADLMRRGASI